MPDTDLIPKIRPSNDRPILVPADRIDFEIDSHCGGLVMFLPISTFAETWIETGGFGHARRWLGVYMLEASEADLLIQRMLVAGLTCRIDGRVVQECSA
jgi:hypothetical protein